MSLRDNGLPVLPARRILPEAASRALPNFDQVRTMLQLRRLVTVAGVLSALAGPLAAQAVNELLVSPENITIRVGERKALTATAFDRVGNVIPTARFTYRSTAPTVASVDGDGTVTGRGAGMGSIEVRAGTKSFTVAVNVSAAASAAVPAAGGGGPIPSNIARVQIDPATIYLVQSETQHLTARAIAQDGSVIGPVQAMWRSLTPGGISIDSINGNVTGIGAGMGTIEARLSNGMSASAPVQVNAVPFEPARKTISLAPDEIDTLRLIVPAQNDRRLEAGLTYSSSNPNIVAIGPTGVMQARSPGQVQIVVTGYFQEARVVVTVHRPIAFLVVNPAPADGPVTVPMHGFRAITGHAEASDSTPIPEAPLHWEVADTTIAVYDSATSHVIGRRAGTTTLLFRTRGYQPTTWTVNVVPAVVSLAQKKLGLRTRDTLSVAAHIKDDQGNDYGAAPDLTWTSDHPEVVKVDASGKLEAVAPGRAMVVASADWGRPDTLEALVTGNLILTSDRRLRGTPGIYQINLARPDSLLPLYTDTRALYAPALSPDRRHVVFSASADGRKYDLWIADADGRNAHLLSPDSLSQTTPAWTPDGQHILYTATQRREKEQLAVMNADGTGRHILTTPPGTSESPAVSPDGRTVAFIGTRDRKVDLYLMDIGGTNIRRVTTGDDKEQAVRWLPNGDLAVLVEMDHDHGFQIARLSGSAYTRSTLVTSPYPIESFSVSRDGSTIAYVTTEPVENVRNQKTKSVLYLVPAASGSTPTAVRTPVTETLGFPAY